MTNTDNVRLAAANLLLDRGVRYVISDAPLFWQLLRLNRIVIRPFKAGTIMEISRVIDENKLNEIKTHADAKKSIDKISLIIAISVLNNRKKIKYFSKILSGIFLWKMPAKVLFTIFYHIMRLNSLTDFMSITRYFEHQARMMLDPKNLGQ